MLYIVPNFISSGGTQMMRDLVIPNPFTFKTALEIALEITLPVLPNDEHESIKELISRVPNELKSVPLSISSEEERQIMDCIAAFKQSKTFYWTRDDFLLALKDIERQFKRSDSA